MDYPNVDHLLPQAMEYVFEYNAVSMSMLQRKMKISFYVATLIVERLEELGVVGPFNGAKPRAVLADKRSWDRIARSLKPERSAGWGEMRL